METHERDVDKIKELLSDGVALTECLTPEELSKALTLSLASQNLDLKFISLLLKNGVDPNQKDFVGMPPLVRVVTNTRASESDRIRAISLLRDNGAEPNEKYKEQDTLQWARRYNPSNSLIHAIVSTQNIQSEQTQDQCIELKKALMEKDSKRVMELREQGAQPRCLGKLGLNLERELELALTSYSSPEIVKAWLEAGADPEAVDAGGMPLVIQTASMLSQLRASGVPSPDGVGYLYSKDTTRERIRNSIANLILLVGKTKTPIMSEQAAWIEAVDLDIYVLTLLSKRSSCEQLKAAVLAGGYDMEAIRLIENDCKDNESLQDVLQQALPQDHINISVVLSLVSHINDAKALTGILHQILYKPPFVGDKQARLVKALLAKGADPNEKINNKNALELVLEQSDGGASSSRIVELFLGSA